MKTKLSLVCLALIMLGISCTKNTGPAASKPIDPATDVSARNLSRANISVAYVEVNSNNFNNVGCFKLANGQQYFDVACIFAANINYDSALGKPVLYFNPQVSNLLNNTTYVANLKAKGIKVLLTVLGNHQNAGWACFTSTTQAADFAGQLKAAVDKYGLDGIDIDDEYSTCTGNNTSLIMVADAMRTAMPTKILSKALFSDIGYFQATWNGKKLGDILDYGWEMSYSSTSGSSRMQPYVNAGMPKSKLVIGVWQQGTGTSGTATLANYAKNNGYKGVMVYDVTSSSTSYLSGISNILYGSATSAAAGCLQ